MKTKTSCLSRRLSPALALALTLWASPFAVSAAALVRGELNREVYTNIFGPLISDLTNSAKFPSAPDLTNTVTYFESPTDWGEMYGERLSGFLIPPVTGDYLFYLCSDDQGALYLSSDHERSNLVQIATESNWSWRRNWTDISAGRTNHENISRPIFLEAGKAYYIEGLHKEFAGGDNFGLAWQPPAASVPVNGSEPIPGYFLGIQRSDVSPFVNVAAPQEGAVLVAGSNVQFVATVLNVDYSLIRVGFYTNDVLLGSLSGPPFASSGNYLLIWSNVPPGEFMMSARVTDASGIVTTSAPVHVTVAQGPPPPGERELHVVSVYSGNYQGGPSPNHEEGKAAVLVNRPGQRVTLCLCAYEPVLWLVTPANGTVIERIILSGMYSQRVQGVGPEVEIVRYGFDGGAGPYFWPGYTVDSGRFYQAVPVIHRITGLEIGSFHGSYTAFYQPPFVIDSLQNDPRLRSDYPQPTPASELPSLSFDLTFFSGSGPGQGEVFSRSYTLSGPAHGNNVLPGLRVVPDAGGRYFYAALPQSVLRVDTQTGTGELMSLGPGVPELSWSMGMAFDSLRNRELLATLGGEGYLYSYSPDTGTWSLVSSMDNRDVDSIVHHRALDQIFAFEVYRADYNRPRLFRFTSGGVYSGEIILPVLPWDIGVSSYASELVSVGEYLILLIGPDAAQPSYPAQRIESRMYLIDPRSNQVWLTYRSVPTNQPPTVVLTAPVEGSVFATGSPIRITANAFDSDGTVQAVEFFADAQALGKIVRGWGTFDLIWSNAPAGNHTLTAKATDSDFATTESMPVHVTVSPPRILDWARPADIMYGTPLSAAQLNATVNINTPGRLIYTPPAGTILGAGQQILSVTFTPVGSVYPIATATVPLLVTRAPLWIRADDKTKEEGTPNSLLTATFRGFVAGDNPATLDTPVTLTTTATLTSPPGKYPIVPSGASDANYDITFENGTLTVLASPAVLPAPEDQRSPAIASDGSGFLVVWLDRRNHAGGSWLECDVYGARVTPDGTVLDKNGILIASNSVWASPPAVAFDGKNYLVVWEEQGQDSLGPIRGSRVSSAGVVVDSPAGFQIGATTARLQSNPRLAFNGSVFLVAWNDWRNQTNGIPDNLICDIYGARVSPEGTVLDPDNIPIIRAPLWQTSADVATIGDEFMVVWQDMNGIYGARVNGAGSVSSPVLVSQGLRGSTAQPVLASSGETYLAAWEESFNIGDNIVWGWVAGDRLAKDGTPLDWHGFGVRTNAGGYNTELAITAAPDAWWLAWNDSGLSSASRGILGARVDPSGAVGQAVPFNILPVMQSEPAIACNRSVLLVAWTDKRNGLDAPYPYFQFGDIYATLVSLDGTVANQQGFLVSSIGREIPLIEWTTPAPITYGAALGSQQLNASANVDGTFAYDPPAGVYLHAGSNQVLTTIFTPADLAHYVRATNHVLIDVAPAQLTIRADDKTRTAGQPNPPLTATYLGLVAGDTPSSLDHPPILTTTAAIDSPPGTYPILITGAESSNYAITHVNGSLTVLPDVEHSGSTDLTFDLTHGAELVGLEGDYGFVGCLALQTDGKLIATGEFIGASGVPCRDLVRLNQDGSADLSFRATISAGRTVDALAIQSNGQILISGSFAEVNHQPRPDLARLNADGSLDASFAPLLEGATHDVVRSIVVQPDGKILIGGNFASVDKQPRYHVARLNADGTVDPTFVPAFMPLGDNSSFNCIALQPDGKVLVGHASCNANIALRRLNPDGSLDESFALGVAPGTWCVGVRKIEIVPDSKLVIYGQFGPWRYVARLNSDGSEDKTFVPPQFLSVVNTILAQPDGKVLIAAPHNEKPGATPNAIFRLNLDGSIDATFQVPDEAVGPLSGVYALALRADGRVLMARSFNSADPNSARAILQLLPDGSVDPAFRYRIHRREPYVYAALALEDGRSIIGGHFSRLNDEPRVGILRVNVDGTLDRAFVPPAEPLYYVEALARQSDGRILVGGSFNSTNVPFSRNLVRLNSDGTLDSSFSLPENADGHVRTLAVQPDAKILAGGGLYIPGGPRFLARFNPDGSLDNTFYQGSGISGEDVSVEAIALQRDGKILVAGTFESYNGIPTTGLFRLLPDGRLDQAFAPPPELQSAWQIGLQPDGKIVALGSALLRLLPDGSLDPAFQAPAQIYGFALEPNGKVIVNGSFDALGSGTAALGLIRLNTDGSPDLTFMCHLTAGWANTIVLQPDGRVLIGGTFEEVNGVERASLARLNNEVVPPRHPADLAPSDWTLGRTEVEAYVAAWRSGQDWTLPPNPIPIDYVTRAVALLLGGQDYLWNGGSDGPPLWWVNKNPFIELPAAKGLEPWATRHLPRSYTPGLPFEVSILLAPQDGARAHALEEQIPAACRVGEISDGGQVDPVHRLIKWGPFAQSAYRLVRYTLAPAGTNSARLTFTGTVSCDGAMQLVEGADLILSGARLAWASPTNNNRLVLQLRADSGNIFVIETSTDLLHWVPMMTVTNNVGTLEIPVPVSPDPQRYYRSRAL